RPRAIAPRRPGCSRTSSTSSTVSGAMTAADVGAVRPHPVSSRRGSGAAGSAGMDSDGEARQPDHTEHLEHAVAQNHLFGRAAASLLDGEGVPEYGEQERDDREAEPERVADL